MNDVFQWCVDLVVWLAYLREAQLRLSGNVGGIIGAVIRFG